MPPVYPSTNTDLREAIRNKPTITYDYTDGLDLKPGSDLHDKIVNRINLRAKESYSYVSGRHETFRDIDRVLTAYVAPDDKEQDIINKDERKPTSIVVPVSFAVLETLLTHFVHTFLGTPVFKFAPREPRDSAGAAALEKVVNSQFQQMSMGLNLYTHWRDCFAYGYGVISPDWYTKQGSRSVYKEKENTGGVLDTLQRIFAPKKYERRQMNSIEYQGPRLRNIDPYTFLPDPNVPIHEPDRGEYVGWLTRDNYNQLLMEEVNGDDYFNVRYLSGQSGMFSSIARNESDPEKTELKRKVDTRADSGTFPCEVIYMIVNLVPKAWGLGNREYPEKWIFGVCGDTVLIMARPLGYNFVGYPVGVSAVDSDMYSMLPASRLEITFGLQHYIDWLLSTHIANVRKAVNDMLIVDPWLVNMADLMNPGPGKLVRLRREQWGRGTQGAVEQLKVNDITKNHVADAGMAIDMVKQISAATDPMLGVMRTSGERRSATEARGAKASAGKRLDKMAMLVSLQSHRRIAYMLASLNQQYMSGTHWVDVYGQYEELLRKEFDVMNDMVPIRPQDINVAFDVLPHDAMKSSGDYADLWLQLIQIIGSNDQLIQMFDMPRIVTHVARLMGAENLPEFVKKQQQEAPAAPPEMRVVPDEEAVAQADSGNLVPTTPLGEAMMNV